MNKLMNTLQGGYPEDSINHKKHPDHDKPGFMVRATSTGYYGLAMRNEGDTFRITHARHFADVDDPKLNGLGWMEKMENPSKAQKRKAEAEAKDFGRGAKPAPEDPAERERRMKAADKMAEESTAEDKDKAEADMI